MRAGGGNAFRIALVVEIKPVVVRSDFSVGDPTFMVRMGLHLFLPGFKIG
jgi:hypothetical protein